jgi:hypothetical protein
MTPQENQALQALLSQLVQIKGVPKDSEADKMIADAAAQQPDALYLLIQRTMILEQAMNAAKEQISQLQQQVQSLQSAQSSTATNKPNSSFLNANAWGNSGATMPNNAPDNAPYNAPYSNDRSVMGTPLPPAMPIQNMAPPPIPARSSFPSFLGGGSGSMLGTMAATAAGVAGGAFLFQGIENLLEQHHHNLAPNNLADNNLGGAGSASQQFADSGVIPDDSSLFSSTNNDDALFSDPGTDDSDLTDNLFDDDNSSDSYDV